MKKTTPAVYVITFLLGLLFASCFVWAATVGLPFTEDFTAENLRYLNDGVILKTTAAWDTDKGALYLDKAQRLYGPFNLDVSGQNAGTNTNLTQALALADIDGDGDLDIIEGNNGSAPEIFLFRRPSCGSNAALPGICLHGHLRSRLSWHR